MSVEDLADDWWEKSNVAAVPADEGTEEEPAAGGAAAAAGKKQSRKRKRVDQAAAETPDVPVEAAAEPTDAPAAKVPVSQRVTRAPICLTISVFCPEETPLGQRRQAQGF